MKKLIPIICVAIFVSCGQKKATLIIGKWKIADITSPKPVTPDSLKAYYDDLLKMQNEEMINNGYYEFRSDGVSAFILNENHFPGKWRFDEKEETLLLKGKNEITETNFAIKDLTNNLLILEQTNQSQTIRMVLKKEIK